MDLQWIQKPQHQSERRTFVESLQQRRDDLARLVEQGLRGGRDVYWLHGELFGYGGYFARKK